MFFLGVEKTFFGVKNAFLGVTNEFFSRKKMSF